MKKFTIVMILLLGYLSFAQVGVGNTNPQATLDITATNTTSPANNDGILIPRMSNFPSTPGATRDGMLIFYTGASASGKGFYYWNNTTMTWIAISSGNKNTLDQAYDEGGPGAGRIINTTDGEVMIIGSDGLTVTKTANDTGSKSLFVSTYVDGNGTSSIYNNLNGNSGTGTNNSAFVIDNYIRTLINNGTIFGINNRFVLGNNSGNSTTTGNIGINNDFYSGSNSGFDVGMNNTFTINSNSHYGVKNQNNTSARGTMYGIHNNFNTLLGSNPSYGVYNLISGAGTGNKYGMYTTISLGSGGTHYGIYSDVRNTNGYAGYFLGRTSLGLGTTNRYLMPEVDGTAGQVMTTDGSGNLNFQTVAGDGDTQNTLDGAYDEGGAGAGRTITADAGAVEIISNNTGSNALRISQTGANNSTSLLIENNGEGTNQGIVVNSAQGNGTMVAGSFTATGALNASTTTAVKAIATAIADPATGIEAQGSGSVNLNYGIKSTAFGGTENWAGYFGDGTYNSGTGNVFVNDDLITEGTFKYRPGGFPVTTGLVLVTAASDGLIGAVNPSTLFTDTQNTLDQAYDEGGAGAGRTITATNGAVHINGTDGFQNTGTFNTGATLALTGAGTKMFFYPRKAAFRAGYVNGTQWNDANIGDYTTALGYNTTASGSRAIAIGDGSISSGSASFAMGNLTIASGNFAVASGSSSIASGSISTAFGWLTNATGDYTTALGYNTTASGNWSAAIGNSLSAPSAYETTMGRYNTLYTPNSTTTWNAGDRLFVIGNGTGTSAFERSNALTIYKSGLMNINDEYNMPLTAGTNGQVMTIDGAGNVTFQNPNTGTDDQNIQNLAFNSSTNILTVGIENGTSQTVNLSALNTDDQNIQNLAFNTTTNILTVGIENGTSQTVDLSILDTGGDVTSITAGTGLTGGGITGAITLNAVGTNGLTTNVDDIRLGGTLFQATTIAQANNDMIFNLDGTGDFRVNDNGTSKLVVLDNGDTVLGGDLYWRDEDTGGTVLGRFIDVNGDDGVLELNNSGILSTHIDGGGDSYLTGGNLGIGTATPDYNLSVSGTLNLREDIAGGGTALRVNGTEALWFDGNLFSWGFGGTANFFSDDVGIGINVPAYKLDVRDANAGDYVAQIFNTSTNANADGLKIRVGNTAVPTASTSYIAFFDGTNTANGRIQGNGTGVTYNTTSDRRLKTNITDIDNALNLIDKIQPRRYEYKANLGTQEYGFIAQELQPLYPQAVTGTPDSDVETNPMMVDYSRLTPLLTAGIKELKEEVDQLKSENEKLKSQLSKYEQLEARLSALETSTTKTDEAILVSKNQ